MTTNTVEPMSSYDAGLLGDGGGGNVEWWHDYIRAELQRADEFYDDQYEALRADHARQSARIAELEAEIGRLRRERDHWKQGHDAFALSAPNPAAKTGGAK